MRALGLAFDEPVCNAPPSSWRDRGPMIRLPIFHRYTADRSLRRLAIGSAWATSDRFLLLTRAVPAFGFLICTAPIERVRRTSSIQVMAILASVLYARK